MKIILIENFTEYEPLERYDVEIIKYESFNSPGLTQFDIILIWEKNHLDLLFKVKI